MFGRGYRRPEQTRASWFPLWGESRSAPQPTMTTQQTATTLPPQKEPSATAGPTAATLVPPSSQPVSRPPSLSQSPAPPGGQKPASTTVSGFRAPQTARSPVAPQPQPRRQSPHKPPIKVPSKTEAQPRPISQVQPFNTVVLDQKTNSQPSLSSTPATIPTGPNSLPASTLRTEAKPKTPEIASSKAPATSPVDSKPQSTSKAPATSPVDSKPQSTSKAPATSPVDSKPQSTSKAPPTSVGAQTEGSSQIITPSGSQVAAAGSSQSQLTSKGTRSIPPTTSQVQHPNSEPTAGKPLSHIQEVGQPLVESNHREEPQPIPKLSDVPRSETKVEILTFTSPENKENAEKLETPNMKSADSLTDPAILAAQPGSDIKTAVQQEKEKQKEASTIEKKANPSVPSPPPRHIALGSCDARGYENKTVVQVRQKDKHLESEVHQGEKAPQVDEGLRRNIHQGISRLQDKQGDAKKQQLQEDPEVRVITLAGENKGAHMDISHGIKRKDGTLHIYRDYKLNHGEKAEQSSEEEERVRNFHDTGKPFMPYINNNTQSVNNSIMYHSSCNSNNPGVHLSVTNNTTEPTRLQRRIVPVEVSGTQPRKHSVEPTVRRRCLRSLFLESSDSDPENPDKPRRHGCRYGCPVKKTETSAAAGSQVTAARSDIHAMIGSG